MSLPSHLAEHLSEQLGGSPVSLTPVSGGDVNAAVCWASPHGERYFIKWNDALGGEVFEREAQGLATLREAGTRVEVPSVRSVGSDFQPGFLILDWFNTVRPGSRGWQALGESVAQLHRNQADAYGFAADNFIGRLPQSNDWTSSWTRFWVEQRILPLLRDSVDQGRMDDSLPARIERLCENAGWFCDREDVKPALLHGDLWSGNVAWTGPEQPIVYDPAVYYGDREVEIAFTELFGGFDPAFHTAYEQAYPLAAGYPARRSFWQLYPLLVHLNMFGRAYLSAVEGALSEAEAALG